MPREYDEIKAENLREDIRNAERMAKKTAELAGDAIVEEAREALENDAQQWADIAERARAQLAAMSQ